MKILIKYYITTIALSLLFWNPVSGQKFQSYEWNENRSFSELSEEEESYGLYYLLKKEQRQYVYDGSGKQLVCYITNHNIIRVNNDEALDKSNQVYIPMQNALELTALKARVINKDGRVINFNNKNLKNLESDEEGYKILAIEGAEVGSEIEYFYTRKIGSANFSTKYLQFTYPVKSFMFSLKSPENLEYDFKVYNANYEVAQTDTTDQYNYYDLAINDITPLYEEDFSAYENSKIRLEFKLAYNSKYKKGRLFTWGDAGKRIYEMIYDLEGAEKKALAKFMKNQDLSGEPIDAFRKVEHYIKTNFYLEEKSGDVGSEINSILKNKYASEKGFTKLYSAVLNHLGIKHELVLTSNRYKTAFDHEFDSWNYLDSYLIYVNETEQFLAPGENAFRLGTISDKHIGTNALFIKLENIQDFKYPVARTGFIPEQPYQNNFDNMDIDVVFSDNQESNTIEVTRSYTGYSAEYYKTGMLFLEQEKIKEMLDEVVKYLALDADIQEIEAIEENTEYNSWHKPFAVKGRFSTSSYIESAGDVVLFKAGELIGPQSELYQEKERVTEIVNTFNRGYIRNIKITIPEGYIIKNLDDIIIKEQVFKGDRLIYNFDSNYTLNGQVLNIKIDEYYDELYYPADDFESFRKVINAAADFNKIVLVMSN
ncbi:MAG: DUF3857 domain-containing protein [Bacteroidota bacterium]